MLQGHSSCNVWMHLQPTGIRYTAGGTFVTPFPQGNENWFSFGETGPAIYTPQAVVILKKATSLFYLTISDGTGGQPAFTIVAYNDAIDDKSIFGGIHY
jgi:hypothetical protein